MVTRVTMYATHNRGEFMGLPPSGKEIVTSGISIERIDDGRIVQRRAESDWLGMMEQLGVVARPVDMFQRAEEAPETIGAG